MNKTIRVLFLVAITATTLVSCKSKQKITEIPGAAVPATTVNVPAETQTVQQAPVTTNTQPEQTRSESFKLASGETNTNAMNMKYHVVVGAFSNHNNARNLRAKLVNEGNNALMVENETGMLRVIIASYNDYTEARAKIDQIRSTYNDAWVLVQKR